MKGGNAKKVLIMLVLAMLLVPAVPLTGMAAGKNVARIGGKSYGSLDKAIESVKRNQTIVLQKNLTVSKPVTVSSGKKFTLDLNRHKIILKADPSNIYYGCIRINGGGNLTVKNGTITDISHSRIFELGTSYGWEDEDDAVLTIQSGTYSGSIWGHANSSIKIINGTFKKTGSDSSGSDFITFESDGKLAIQKGSFSGYKFRIYGGKLTVQNGRFKNVQVECSDDGDRKGSMLFNGGTFKSDSSSYGIMNISCTGKVTLNGGEFSVANKASYVRVIGMSIPVGTDGPVLIINKKAVISCAGDGEAIQSGGKTIMKGGKITGKVEIWEGSFVMQGGSIRFDGTGSGAVDVLSEMTMTGGKIYASQRPALNVEGKTVLKGGELTGKDKAVMCSTRKDRLQVSGKVVLKHLDPDGKDIEYAAVL